MNRNHRNTTPSGRGRNQGTRVSRRRTNRVIPAWTLDRFQPTNDFVFMGKSGQFEGYFKTDYNPDETYDPNHLCLEWGEFCTKNLNFKPSQLIAAEQDKKNPLNKAKVKSLETEMKKLKEILLENLQNEYETPKQAASIISMMKTYSWLCNELLRVKF